MNKLKIVTHGGLSHADDVLAVALILLEEARPDESVEILRPNNCKPDEVADADYVVDVGGEYCPERKRFDHHQFTKDHPPECAFSLVARYFGYSTAEFRWMDKMTMLDSKGPYEWFRAEFGRRHESEKEVKAALREDELVWNYFPRLANVCGPSTESFAEAVRAARRWLGLEIDAARKSKRAKEQALANLRILDMGHFKMAFFDQREAKGTFEVCDDLAAADPSVIISGKRDDRGDGYSAVRLSDNPRVDFSPLQGQPGCVFSHANGFCVKWRDDWSEYLDAVWASVCLPVVNEPPGGLPPPWPKGPKDHWGA